jgi:uncharacterized protein DUF4389
MQASPYPVQFAVDYLDAPRDRLSVGLRIFYAIPILIVFGTVSGGNWSWSSESGQAGAAGAGGLLAAGPALMIIFRQKYPRWWFDWNLELQRFLNRVTAYLALMVDTYPSTDEHQAVHLDYVYPDVPRDLNRWLPLIKWLLAIPHFIVLVFLNIAAFFVVVIVWFTILFTGEYPPELFRFVEGVMRWNNRVVAYTITFVTDSYPPFRLSA